MVFGIMPVLINPLQPTELKVLKSNITVYLVIENALQNWEGIWEDREEED